MDKKKLDDLIIANKKLAFQKEEKEKEVEELIISTNTKIIEGKKDEEYIGHLVAIVESSDDAIISQSLDGTIKSWNKGAEKMFGYTGKQAVGKHISLIIPPEYINEAKKILKRICDTEIIDHYETVRNRKNGNQFYVSLTVSPLKDRTGNIIGISKIARDITSRKKSDAELFYANKELSFQNHEKEKRAAELSIANIKLTFQDAEREKRAAELSIANDKLAFQNTEKEKRAAELSIANIELTFQNHEKEKRAAELIIANKELAFQNDEKEKLAAELTIANIELAFQNDEKGKRAAELVILSGDLKVQKEELKRANDDLEKRVFERTCELETLNHELKDLSVSKDKFLSVISHDLRNPLTALLLASDELNSHSENNTFEPIQPFIQIIHRNSHNILKQLNELVDWAKMHQEKTNLNPEKIHLASAVDQSFELLKSNATQKNIFFENKVPLDIYVKADALMLRSIIQNLVTNSIKYSLQGGLVMITAQHLDTLAEICVIDSGIGMEENTKENLFTKNNSASVSGTNNEKGSGLGLILVKDFVAQNGGTLRVDSEIEKGTCIFFTIPKY